MNMNLKEQLEMAYHNLLCFSNNYLMSEPKKGYEEVWKMTKEEIKRLEKEIG